MHVLASTEDAGPATESQTVSNFASDVQTIVVSHVRSGMENVSDPCIEREHSLPFKEGKVQLGRDSRSHPK